MCRFHTLPGAAGAMNGRPGAGLPPDAFGFREKRKSPGPAGTPRQEPEDRAGTDARREILCRQCRRAITDSEQRIVVNGAHRHTFANPQGIVFEIGCFREAKNCGTVGRATDEFTWFPGFRWRIAICGGCLTHLGWLFTSDGSGSFYGLILDRLVFPP